MKPTLVIGASTNPYRYANLAIQRLKSDRYEVFALGLHPGNVAGVPIHTRKEDIKTGRFDTISLYINPLNQAEYEDWILSLQPKRVIFNPGTENPSFEHKLAEHGIETLRACTLIMLSTAQY